MSITPKQDKRDDPRVWNSCLPLVVTGLQTSTATTLLRTHTRITTFCDAPLYPQYGSLHQLNNTDPSSFSLFPPRPPTHLPVTTPQSTAPSTIPSYPPCAGRAGDSEAFPAPVSRWPDAVAAEWRHPAPGPDVATVRPRLLLRGPGTTSSCRRHL